VNILRVEADKLRRTCRRRRECGLARLDDEERVSHGLCVDLATVRIESDGVHVHTRRQPLAPNDGLGGVCRRRDNVGTPDRFLVRAHRPRLRAELVGERCGFCRVTPCDADLVELPNALQRACV
jgi:hypothetical protein